MGRGRNGSQGLGTSALTSSLLDESEAASLQENSSEEVWDGALPDSRPAYASLASPRIPRPHKLQVNFLELDSKKLTSKLCVVYVVFSHSRNMPSNMATRHPGNQEPCKSPTHGSCPAHESSRYCRPARPFQPLNVPYSVAAAGSAHT